jgi:hypothetical protein
MSNSPLQPAHPGRVDGIARNWRDFARGRIEARRLITVSRSNARVRNRWRRQIT